MKENDQQHVIYWDTDNWSISALEYLGTSTCGIYDSSKTSTPWPSEITSGWKYYVKDDGWIESSDGEIVITIVNLSGN